MCIGWSDDMFFTDGIEDMETSIMPRPKTDETIHRIRRLHYLPLPQMQHRSWLGRYDFCCI